MAKRNCRRTKDEKEIHEKALKMKKKTDEQLVHYVEDRVEKARSEGFNKGFEQGFVKGQASVPKIGISAIVDEIGKIAGIGAGKVNMIRMALEKRFG